MSRPSRYRPERRVDYRHFPPSYTELIERFERDGTVRLGPMTRKECLANRHRINRFLGFLRNADPSDGYARALYEVAATMTNTIQPAADGDSYWLVWHLDPIVALLPTATPAQPKQASPALPEEDNDPCPKWTR